MSRRRSTALLVLALVSLAACKRKQDVTALSKDDGKGNGIECKLAAGGRISVDTTIKSGCLVTVDAPYFITGNATLKIEPGAKLAFKRGARLVVEDGAISAQGRKLEPITFTSAEPSPAAGDWGGLVFKSAKTSVLEGVVVEYAGDDPTVTTAAPPGAGGDAGPAPASPPPSSYAILGSLGGGRVGSRKPLPDRKPAVMIAKGGRLSLVDSTIRHGARVGLASDDDAPFARFEKVTFDANGGYAMDLPANALGQVSSLTSAEPVRVRGEVTSTQGWPKLEVVVASLEVVSGEKGGAIVLTLAPETVVRIEPKTSLRIGGYHEGGALVAHKVLFTSAAPKPAPGDWDGLHFGKRAPGTVIDASTIEFAGYEDPPPPPSPSAKPKAKGVKELARPKASALVILEPMKDFQITNNVFRNNAGPGMGKSESYMLWGLGGTGGCEGLDAPKLGNKSIGQPLCEYHEDPMAGIFGSSLDSLTGDGLVGGGVAFGSGGLGMSGIGAGGSGAGGGLTAGGLGGIGHGGGVGTGSGAGYGGGQIGTLGGSGGSAGKGGGSAGKGSP